MILDSLENKRNILAKFLQLCPLEGWSEEVLTQAIIECKIEAKFKNLLFENGCLDLIQFYIEEKNRNLAQIIAAEPNFSSFKIRQKIKFALYNLFESEKENQLALQRLRNFYFNPKNFTTVKYGPKPLLMAFQHVGKIANFIWKEIGDKSTDFNFYTKRLTLSKIILQTFAVFVKDQSQNLQVTKNFIDLQIEKVMKFVKMKSQVKNFSANLCEKSGQFFHDESGNLKTPKQVFTSLPFVRLFKK